MKGVELPINILVVVAIAVIVLLGLVALYFSGFLGPAGTMTQESAKNTACAQVMNNVNGCMTVIPANILLDGTATSAGRFDTNRDGRICGPTIVGCVAADYDTLQTLCERYYAIGVGDAANCRKLCGCTG